MFPLKATLLSTLLVLTIATVAPPTTVVALPTEGPFWQVNGTKLPQGMKKNVVGSLHKAASGFQIVGTKWIKTTCIKGEATGTIFNGTQHGEGIARATASECSELEESSEKHGVYKKVAAGCKVEEPLEGEAVGALWYHATNLNRTRTNKIQTTGFPAGGGVFTDYVLNSACGALHGEYEVFGSAAAELSPQYTEVLEGQLIFPTEQQDHVWQPKNTPEETQLRLSFAGKPADGVAEANIRLESKEPFGVIE